MSEQERAISEQDVAISEQGRGTATQGERYDRRALERLMTFGDAVVAIAITLIVLPLVDVAMAAPEALAFFTQHRATLGAAALSFVVVAATWHAHHKLFILATGYNPAIFWSEVVWLAAEIFLPVATVLDIFGSSASRPALATYIGDLLVIIVTIRIQAVLLEHYGLAPRSHLPAWIRWHLVVTWSVVLALAMAFPRVGSRWILLVLVESLITSAVRRRMARAKGASRWDVYQP